MTKFSIFLLSTCFFNYCFADNVKANDYFKLQEYKKAKIEFLKSSENKESQFYLGIIFLNGLGVEKNDEEAFKWFNLTSQQIMPNQNSY